MAEHCSKNLIILFFMVTTGTCAEKFNDDVKDTRPIYLKMSMDKDTICDPYPVTIGKKTISKTIDLKFKNYALIVHPGHTLDTWYNVVNNKNCQFKVKAPKGEGLFAVIQSMNLRQEGSECLDFIRFSLESGNSSEKFCGQYDRTPGSNNYNTFYENRIQGLKAQDFIHQIPSKYFEELSRDGKIITEIFISKQPLGPGESLNLTITYTPFKDCGHDEIEKYPKIFSRQTRACISPNYICDSNFNCVSSMCYDEDRSICSYDQLNTLDGYKTLTLTAVTSTFLCFIIFVMCLYICRKNEKLCWSSDCAGPSDTGAGNTLSLDQNTGNRPYVSSAPMLEVAVSSLHDKDLPPSYDSLFPSQPSTASS